MEFPINAILGAAAYLVVSWFLKQRRIKKLKKLFKITTKEAIKAAKWVDEMRSDINDEYGEHPEIPKELQGVIHVSPGLGDYLPGPVVDLKVRNAEISSARIEYLNLGFDTDKKEDNK